jgi:DNA-binding SARP family transcriptional activator
MSFRVWRRLTSAAIVITMRAERQPVALPVLGIVASMGACQVPEGGELRSDPVPPADAAMDAAARDLGLDALCRAQILAFIGQPSAALDLLHEALQPLREAGDDTLLVAIQSARLRILEMQPNGLDVAALRTEILGLARRLGFVWPMPVDAGRAAAPGAIETGGLAVRSDPRSTQSVPGEIKAEAPPEVDVPVRIRTLGAFVVLVNGQPFACGRKAPHRPLALLQALIALGGHNVAATVVVDALWSDADGGCGRRALDVALLRLRRLLGRDDAILVSGGRLSINSELCWVDAWAFERAVEAAEDLGPGSAPERLRQVADTVISLYQGRFLCAEDDRPWMMPARDRLAAKFARAVGSCARALVAAGLRNEAEALYRRGLELDNLSEALYRGLMDCCAEQGHRAEAINAYRRCRELLSIVLNTRPSEQTELLYRQLSAG